MKIRPRAGIKKISGLFRKAHPDTRVKPGGAPDPQKVAATPSERPDTFSEKAKADAKRAADAETNADGKQTTLADASKPLEVEAANDQRSAQTAAEAIATDADLHDPDKLEGKKTPLATRLKAFAANNYIKIAMALAALGVTTYFVVTAAMRKQCIEDLFARYPDFRDEKTLLRILDKIGDACVGANEGTAIYAGTTLSCADINDAFRRLSQCDNTLMRNIVTEMLNAGTQLVDWGLDKVDDATDALAGSLKKLLVPIAIGVGVLVVLAAVVFIVRHMYQKRKLRRVAPEASFGTRRRGSLWPPSAYGTRVRRLAR
jgi:hypothetical protein